MVEDPIKCPYRELCQCPGYEKGEEDWIPIDGFILTKEGILCIDWNLLLPLEKIAFLRTTEGRHIADAITSADKLDAAMRKYNRSPKRRAAQIRYEQKDKGKETARKFRETEKFRLSQQKYYYSQKGQAAHIKRRGIVRDFREADKWLKDNPGMTFDDFMEGKSESS